MPPAFFDADLTASLLREVPNGRSPLLHGWREHNALQPTFRHRVAAVRNNRAAKR